MASVLVAGAGIAGCAAAVRLAGAGVPVLLIERGARVGGRVRGYGCKATDRCNNCGVCLAAGLWDKAEHHPLIRLYTSSSVEGLEGAEGDFTAELRTPCGTVYHGGVAEAVVATGFENLPCGMSAHMQIEGTQGLVTGTEIERAMLGRGRDGWLEQPPKSVAFIQCFGSRDTREGAGYCSRVCCSYTTRTARVMRQYYPGCEIVFFYMELQVAANRDVYAELAGMGVEFVKCRPAAIKGGSPAVVCYDHPARGRILREFDLVVLSEGVHPARGAGEVAAAFGLGRDADGFLSAAGARAGLHVAGCARAPMKIDEAYADAAAVAGAIAARAAGRGGLCV